MLNGKWMAILGVLFLVSCATSFKQAPHTESYHGQSYWLKQSLYGGIFYDDDRYRMLSKQPFESLRHLKTPAGDWILPPQSDEIIPVCTRIQIQKVEWPTEFNVIKRPLLTPRYLPWVYLTVALDRGSVSLNREKTYMLLVPEEIHTEKDFKDWLSGYFSKEDNNLWFLNLSPKEREIVLQP